MDWRETLKTLQDQFAAKAAQSRGLHHLFVEVGDHERDRAGGPDWIANKFIEQNRETNDPWQIVSYSTLVGVESRFREWVARDESNPEARIIRDGNGQPRAVFEPLRLRSSYLCGDDQSLAAFESLAEAAARVLSGADLANHEYAQELTDLFHAPVGGIRYVFGAVTDPPSESTSHGWQAGMLVYPDGVLIDQPVSRSAPSAGHWLLLMHRLSWRQTTGSPLNGVQLAWRENLTVPYEWVRSPDSINQVPPPLRQKVAEVSASSYFSILGTKANPLDVFLASSFAIQALLSNKPPAPPSSRTRTPPNYAHEHWRALPLPSPVSAEFDEVLEKIPPQVAVLTATPIERDMVLRHMTPAHARLTVLQVFRGPNTYFVGRLGLQTVVLCMCDMGAVGRDAALAVTAELLRDWSPKAVMMVGIAFGRDSDNQRIGDVLVADRLIAYEPARISPGDQTPRGHHVQAGPKVLNRLRNAIGWTFTGPTGVQSRALFGPVLSGEKLIDNADFKAELFIRYGSAIGGEMEGAGLAAAAGRVSCEWALVKGICDWADGHKRNPQRESDQDFAAAAAVSLIRHVLIQPGAF